MILYSEGRFTHSNDYVSSCTVSAGLRVENIDMGERSYAHLSAIGENYDGRPGQDSDFLDVKRRSKKCESSQLVTVV